MWVNAAPPRQKKQKSTNKQCHDCVGYYVLAGVCLLLFPAPQELDAGGGLEILAGRSHVHETSGRRLEGGGGGVCWLRP